MLWQFLVRTVLLSFSFVYLFPKISGFHFSGRIYPEGVAMAVVFSLTAFLFEALLKFVTVVLGIGTLGLALLVIIPMWILGFWLLPALELKLVADFFPEYLRIHGWVPAILAGLLIMLIYAVTKSNRKRH